MKYAKTLLIVSAIATTLSGCVITVHDDNGDHEPSWRVRQVENRNAISQLTIGLPISQVTEQLGGADDSEGFESGGKSYVVLFYRTSHRREDGETTRDETTPLVFEEGQLIGWGYSALNKVKP